MSFADRLDDALARVGNPCLVGIDPHLDLLPDEFARARDRSLPRVVRADALVAFGCALVDVAAEHVAAVKPQSAFFEVLGADGVRAWEAVVAHAHARGLLVIGDVKRSDIASTAAAYASAFLEGASSDDAERASLCDAVTVNPYLGEDSMQPFLDACARAGTGLFVLVRTSNPGADLFQAHGEPPLADEVARAVARWGADLVGACGLSSVGAVVGATRPDELERLRALMPRTPFLLPGYGAQGAGAADVTAAFPDPEHPWRGGLINSSRGIAFAHTRPEHRGKRWADAVRDALATMVDDVRGALGGAGTVSEPDERHTTQVAVTLEHLAADAIGLSEQARSVLAERPEPSALPGVRVPDDVASLPRPPERLEPGDRRALAKTLERELARFGPHVHVVDAVRSLAEPGACVVIAGQQPGFLGGVLYNVYKALHVVRLAAVLREAWGVPVVPAFWNDADDHDIAEVHHLWIQNPNLDLRKVGMSGASSGREPFFRITFDEERQRLGALGELLAQNLTGKKGAVREALEVFLPRSGERFSEAFTRVLLHLFGAHGLVVCEPQWIREPLSRALARIVQADVAEPLARGAERLAAAGQPVPIAPQSGALCFRLGDGGRHALRLSDDEPGALRYDDEPGSRTPAELAAEILQAPEEWSPGALLRPIAQDLTLPVAAYVGGWGELAYHAQLCELRDAVGAPRTPFVPRLGATVVDAETRASLETLGLSVLDVLRARGEVSADDEEADDEPQVLGELRLLAERTTEELSDLKPGIEAIDRGLGNQVGRAARDVRRALERLAGKLERVHANSAGRGQRHFRRVNNALFPNGAPQERVRGALEVVARFGTSWIDELAGDIEPFPTEHLVVHLAPVPSGRSEVRP